MVIEGALKDKLEALKFKPTSRRTGKPLVGAAPAPAPAPRPPALAVHVAVRCRPGLQGDVASVQAEPSGDKTVLKIGRSEAVTEGLAYS